MLVNVIVEEPSRFWERGVVRTIGSMPEAKTDLQAWRLGYVVRWRCLVSSWGIVAA